LWVGAVVGGQGAGAAAASGELGRVMTNIRAPHRMCTARGGHTQIRPWCHRRIQHGCTPTTTIRSMRGRFLAGGWCVVCVKRRTVVRLGLPPLHKDVAASAPSPACKTAEYHSLLGHQVARTYRVNVNCGGGGAATGLLRTLSTVFPTTLRVVLRGQAAVRYDANRSLLARRRTAT